MTGLVGVFLIAHGLLHLAIWITPLQPDAPFDPRHSWLLGRIDVPARLLAVASGLAFVVAGTLIFAEAGSAELTAGVASLVSLILIALTFNLWLSLAVVLDVVIAVEAFG